MTTYTVTSNDTLVLNGNVFNDLATDDVTTITFPNDLVNMKTGKNGNTIMAQNQQGFNANLALRVMRGSTDDQVLESILAASLNDFPSTALLAGSFVKRLGDGQGNVINDVYTLAGGVISKMVEGKENVGGDVMQAEAVYNIKFANAVRVIQ
ncbi:MAG: hypothetical protein LAP61_05630 [Acidobacteriia bacterium]|nr:hypothetical protein [Terriglobia bacterium]